MSETRHAQLVSWLEDQGHSEAEIAKVLARVDDYDRRTVHESVFDAIDSGSLDLESIVREALDGGGEGAGDG
ncbi:MAG: hypothetical protein AAF790_12315 [Planctomycetota bacterium]